MSDEELTAAFVRRVTPIIVVCARAIEQASDLSEPRILPRDLLHFVTEIHKLTSEITNMVE